MRRVIYDAITFYPNYSGTEKQTKEKVFGPDIRGRPGVIRADVPGRKLRAGPRNLGKNCIWVRTSMTRMRGGGAKKSVFEM